MFSGSTDEQMLERHHRKFGNTPCFLFSKSELLLKQRIQLKDADLLALTADMAKSIMNNVAALNSDEASEPRSSIVCVTSKPPDFLPAVANYASDCIAEQVARVHMHNLWNDICVSGSPRRQHIS